MGIKIDVSDSEKWRRMQVIALESARKQLLEDLLRVTGLGEYIADEISAAVRSIEREE